MPLPSSTYALPNSSSPVFDSVTTSQTAAPREVTSDPLLTSSSLLKYMPQFYASAFLTSIIMLTYISTFFFFFLDNIYVFFFFLGLPIFLLPFLPPPFSFHICLIQTKWNIMGTRGKIMTILLPLHRRLNPPPPLLYPQLVPLFFILIN
jgi:hypothetical protein